MKWLGLCKQQQANITHLIIISRRNKSESLWMLYEHYARIYVPTTCGNVKKCEVFRGV